MISFFQHLTAGGSVKVKHPNDSDEKIESLVGENGENHATWLRD